jgi:hypothetical protein
MWKASFVASRTWVRLVLSSNPWGLGVQFPALYTCSRFIRCPFWQAPLPSHHKIDHILPFVGGVKSRVDFGWRGVGGHSCECAHHQYAWWGECDEVGSFVARSVTDGGNSGRGSRTYGPLTSDKNKICLSLFKPSCYAYLFGSGAA